MTTAAKKFRSNWFRIATEGATTDGRKIERQWIEDMANGYDRKLYGARVNCEHIKSLLPDSPFGAYGDVLALKSEEVELGGQKKLTLLAQIEPNEAGVALNKKGQKIYTSAEVSPEFADTGKAYLVGLALTDSPASLGTDALQFSSQHGTLTSRKTNPDNLFTAAEEVEALKFEEVVETPSLFSGLREKVTELLSKSKDKEGKDATNFAELGAVIEQIATHGAEQAEAFTTEKASREKLQAAHDKLSADFADLIKRLGDTEDHSQQHRPAITGGDGKVVAEY